MESCCPGRGELTRQREHSVCNWMHFTGSTMSIHLEIRDLNHECSLVKNRLFSHIKDTIKQEVQPDSRDELK